MTRPKQSLHDQSVREKPWLICTMCGDHYSRCPPECEEKAEEKYENPPDEGTEDRIIWLLACWHRTEEVSCVEAYDYAERLVAHLKTDGFHINPQQPH